MYHYQVRAMDEFVANGKEMYACDEVTLGRASDSNYIRGRPPMQASWLDSWRPEEA